MTDLTRRTFVASAAFLPLLAGQGLAQGGSLTAMVVHKDPNCGCCGGWVDYMKENGFHATVIETANLDKVRARLGVPAALQSCHTAEIGGYVIEGHVPAGPIKRLLAERPKAIGLAVAGMPNSSPGMDVPGASDRYDVTLFGKDGQKRYARYAGPREIAR